MGHRTSELLALLVISLSLLLLLPSAAVATATAKAIDASKVQRLELPDSLVGPESVAFDGRGAGPYVSVADGRVLRWGGNGNGSGSGWTTYTYSPSYSKNNCATPSELPPVATESSCGRPLGLRFHRRSGTLYVADAYMGLMRVGPGGGEATVVATEAVGEPLRFANGVDVDQRTGEVYFTDSSSTYRRSQHQMVTATGDSTGRIMRYDPRTGEVAVLQSGVTYPNGVAVSADGTHLVVALTGPCKLLRYWLRGPKAGTSETLADLPGYPDNVRPDGKGGYWVALHREKNEFPFGVNSHLVAVRIGADGETQQDMKGPKNVRRSRCSLAHTRAPMFNLKAYLKCSWSGRSLVLYSENVGGETPRAVLEIVLSSFVPAAKILARSLYTQAEPGRLLTMPVVNPCPRNCN